MAPRCARLDRGPSTCTDAVRAAQEPAAAREEDREWDLRAEKEVHAEGGSGKAAGYREEARDP